jgi:hypothetical protein
VALHWPLVNRPGSLLEQLGKRELELKRQHDGEAYKQAQPSYRCVRWTGGAPGGIRSSGDRCRVCRHGGGAANVT